MDQLPATRPEVVFTSVAELVRWARATGLRRAPVRMGLKLSVLSRQEQRYWQERIEHAYNDCGCSSAAVSLFGLIAAAMAYGGVIGFEQSPGLVAAGTAAAAIAALLAGKLLGLAWSRRTLRRHVAHMAHLVESRGADESFS